MMKSVRAYHAIAALLTSLVVTGCISTFEAPAGLRTEKHSDAGIQVKSVHIEKTKSGLRVSGTVDRMIGYANSARRHLDVEVIDKSGEMLNRVPVSFNPNPIRYSTRSSTSSDFAITLPAIPSPGSVVRVAVHPTSISDCRN